jgi:hypothetical protein
MRADSTAEASPPEPSHGNTRIAGQGERPWRVYAPLHMTADAVQACAVSILGPLATFERTQPKGAFSFQSEAPSTGNSRYFGANDLLERPLPFNTCNTFSTCARKRC